MEQTEIESLFKIAEIQIVYRNKVGVKDRPKITGSRDANSILRSVWDMNRIELLEQFKLMLMDRRNACIGISDIATGGIAGCVVDPKIIFATALKARASGIIMAHNHPSGNLTPSQADIDLTRKMKEAGKLLEISVLDHLIMTSESYYSFADEGLIP
jgi:DNA repair protein RadC